MLKTADAIGGIIGTYIVLRANSYKKKGFLVLVATLIYAVLLFGFGINRVFFIGLVFIAGLGIMDAISQAMRQTIVQLTTPDRLLGRASSAHSFAASGANHLGQIEVGIMSGIIGAGNTLILGGAISLLVVFGVWYLIQSIRKYSYDPEHPYETE